MGSTIQKTGKFGQTAGPIGNQFCTYNADESGNGHSLNKLAPGDIKGEHFDMGLSRGNFWGFRGVNISSKVWECHDIQRIFFKKNVLIIKCTNRYNFATTISGEAG